MIISYIWTTELSVQTVEGRVIDLSLVPRNRYGVPTEKPRKPPGLNVFPDGAGLVCDTSSLRTANAYDERSHAPVWASGTFSAENLEDIAANEQCVHWESNTPLFICTYVFRESCFDCCNRDVGYFTSN